jgi:hypothetical protein
MAYSSDNLVSFKDMLETICAETYKDESGNNIPNKLNKDFSPDSPEFFNLLSGHRLYSTRYISKKYLKYNEDNNNNYNKFLRCFNENPDNYDMFKTKALDPYVKAFKYFKVLAIIGCCIFGLCIIVSMVMMVIMVFSEEKNEDFEIVGIAALIVLVVFLIIGLIIGWAVIPKRDTEENDEENDNGPNKILGRYNKRVFCYLMNKDCFAKKYKNFNCGPQLNNT